MYSTYQPTAIFTFDDGLVDSYTTAYPILSGHGFPATCFVVSNYIGGGGCLTLANCTALYSAGWDIANHTASHLVLTGGQEAAWMADVATCDAWLHTNSFDRARNIIAAPSGQYTTASLQLLAAAGYKLHRSANWYKYTSIRDSLLALLVFYCDSSAGNSLADALSALTVAKTSGSCIVFCLHYLQATSGVNQWATADFTTLVASVASSGMRVMSASQWLSAIQTVRCDTRMVAARPAVHNDGTRTRYFPDAAMRTSLMADGTVGPNVTAQDVGNGAAEYVYPWTPQQAGL